MNKFVSKFLHDVCTEVKYKKIHTELSKELQCHIDELMFEYIEKGMNEEEAAKEAVNQMGNPFQIGKKLNNTHKPKTEWSIVALIITMVLIGAVTFISITSTNAIASSPTSYITYVILGIVVCLTCYLFDYTKIEKYSFHIFIGTITFLFFSPLFSIRVNGTPFLRIGPFIIMPTTIVIPFLLISFAGLLNKWCTYSIKDMIKLISLALISILIFVNIPSTVNAMMISCGYIVMLTIAITNKDFKGNRKKTLLSLYASGITIFLYFIAVEPYRMRRLFSFINPESDPTGDGYQNFMLHKMLSYAKLLGNNKSLFIDINGTKHMALPALNSEFIFTYIVCAFGWIIGAFVIIIFALTIIRIFFAIKKIHSPFGKYMASSIITVFSLQSIANILMNLGFFPIVGISLPFISYGGSSFMINMILLGLLLSVYRRKDLVIVSL